MKKGGLHGIFMGRNGIFMGRNGIFMGRNEIFMGRNGMLAQSIVGIFSIQQVQWGLISAECSWNIKGMVYSLKNHVNLVGFTSKK
jgi:hypothetical protein